MITDYSRGGILRAMIDKRKSGHAITLYDLGKMLISGLLGGVIEMTEAEAKSAVSNSALIPGRYKITLNGTSGGAVNDIIWLEALESNKFSEMVDYRHKITGRDVSVRGVFDSTGWTLKVSDSNAEIDSTARYNGSGTFTLTGYEVFGVHRIVVPGGTDLQTINGGYEGCEITFYGTGGAFSSINFATGGNLYIDPNLGGAFAMLDDNIGNITFRKRGASFIERHRSTTV